MADGDPIRIGQAYTASTETTLSRNAATASTVFVARNLNEGNAIYGVANSRVGVAGYSNSGYGVGGHSVNSNGVSGTSDRSVGVRGAGGVFAAEGEETDTGDGVQGYSTNSTGVVGYSTNSTGVVGYSNGHTGVYAVSNGYYGVEAWNTSTDGYGVAGFNEGGGKGLAGYSFRSGGGSSTGTGVYGSSDGGIGVRGRSRGSGSAGVSGESRDSTGIGVYGLGTAGAGGVFDGGITVNGDLTVVNGNKAFKIDHPLDPQNKYLLHNAVESSERKNVYDGVAHLDENGEALVELPEWFEVLNGDFRYQLTAIGGAAPDLHVAEEVSENRFKIGGGEEGMKICWQLTGSRKDPWAAANPFEVELGKPEEEQGRYLEPGLYDASEEQRVMMGPVAEAVEEEQRPPEPSGIDFSRLEEEHRRRIDELRRQEEEHRREMEELRRRMEEQQEEAPPEST